MILLIHNICGFYQLLMDFVKNKIRDIIFLKTSNNIENSKVIKNFFKSIQ